MSKPSILEDFKVEIASIYKFVDSLSHAGRFIGKVVVKHQPAVINEVRHNQLYLLFRVFVVVAAINESGAYRLRPETV